MDFSCFSNALNEGFSYLIMNKNISGDKKSVETFCFRRALGGAGIPTENRREPLDASDGGTDHGK